jgi:uncharacterized protein (TIGR00297 family)
MNLLSPPSTTEWLRLVAFICGISLFIIVAEIVRKFFGWSPEATRKLVHILVGVLVFFTPMLFTTALPVVILAIIFIVVNFASLKLGLLKGMQGTRRVNYGTVYYPLAFLILILLGWYEHKIIVITAIMVLAFGDSFAAIVGESLKLPHNYHLTRDRKSVEGSVTMFVVSAFAIFGCLTFFSQVHINGMDVYSLSVGSAVVIALIAGAFATAWEAISSRGLDNLTVPFSSAFVLHYMLSSLPHHDSSQFVFGMILALCIAVISFHLRFLTASGGVATFILAQLIFGVGGWKWTSPILTFFILSSVLSKIGRKQKSNLDLIFEKSSTRDARQVAGNGGIAGIFALLWSFFPQEIYYYAYLGTLAAVTADTWGTEIGVFSKTDPRLIINLRKVHAGTSGGISLLGTLASYFGAVAIFLSGLGWLIRINPFPLTLLSLFLVVTVSGFIGSLCDSVLGATIQAQYRCHVCGKVTEKTIHCAESTKQIKGRIWLTNDAVNTVCALTGGVVTLVVLWIG